MRISDVIDGRHHVDDEKKRKKLLTMLLIITGILSLVFIAVTIYGQYTGTFVLSLSDQATDRGIEISDEPLFTQSKSSLSFDPLDNAREFEYSAISGEELRALRATNGQYSEGAPYYIAYTFYLRNAGTLTTEVLYRIRFTQVINRLNEVVKVHMIHTTLDNQMIRQETFGLAENADALNPDYWIIADDTVGLLAPQEVNKFTLIVWINGPQTNQSHVKGAVKMEMVFTIVGEVS